MNTTVRLRMAWTMIALLIAPTALAASVNVTGAAPGTRLQSLVNSPTLVTVVVEYEAEVRDRQTGETRTVMREAADPNLRVIDVQPNFFTVLTEDGERLSYLVDSVSEVRVQGGVVEVPESDPLDLRALRPEQQAIVDEAYRRAEALFNSVRDDQETRIRAAELLALQDHQDAIDYLRSLAAAGGDSAQVRMMAAHALFMAGKEVAVSDFLEAIRSGSRPARALASEIAGMANIEELTPELNTLVQDQAAGVAGPAAVALARMGNREVIPRLLTMVAEPNEMKADAAVKALSILGGNDVIEQMRLQLPRTTGQARFRIILVLHALGDETGTRELVDTIENVPTLAPQAALALAREGHNAGIEYIRQRLERSINQVDRARIERAHNAAALFESGDVNAMGIFQILLRSDSPRVAEEVCESATDAYSRLCNQSSPTQTPRFPSSAAPRPSAFRTRSIANATSPRSFNWGA